MPERPPKCLIKDIPRRLHWRGRPKKVVPGDDRLYVRHPPLPIGHTYVFGIPEHRCLEDQSANSEKLNTPSGDPRDVLYDTKLGNHYMNYQIARVDVDEVRELSVPNPNTIVYDEHNNIKEQHVFTFRPEHEPTACMYPHCVIYAFRNGTSVKKVAAGVTTAIRLEFGRVAENHRLEMLKFQRPRVRLADILCLAWAVLQSVGVCAYLQARAILLRRA